METNQPQLSEITELIQSFVDSIERALIERGLPRSQRNNICDEVESQIQTMIERRVQAGAELNLELVHSIIESMDPAESYRQTAQPVANESVASSEVESRKESRLPSVDHALASLGAFTKGWQEFISKQLRGSQSMQWLAALGLGISILGCLFLPFGMSRRHEEMSVLGFLLLFAGTIASAIAFWRIRSSNGRLRGQTVASIGILVMPMAFMNGILAAVLILGRVGLVIGALAVFAAVIYGNYRFVRYALEWLVTSSIGAESVSESPGPTTGPESTGSTSNNGTDLVDGLSPIA